MLRDLFKNDIPSLERWSKRDILTSRRLNQPVDALNALTRGVRSAQQVPMQAGGATQAESAATATVKYVAVRGIGEATDNFVKAQEIGPKPNAEGAWLGEWNAVGDIVDVLVYPTQRAGDFAEYVWPEDVPFNSFLTPLPLVRVGDNWWLWMYLPFTAAPIPDGMIFGDCQPQGSV